MFARQIDMHGRRVSPTHSLQQSWHFPSLQHIAASTHMRPPQQIKALLRCACLYCFALPCLALSLSLSTRKEKRKVAGDSSISPSILSLSQHIYTRDTYISVGWMCKPRQPFQLQTDQLYHLLVFLLALLLAGCQELRIESASVVRAARRRRRRRQQWAAGDRLIRRNVVGPNRAGRSCVLCALQLLQHSSRGKQLRSIYICSIYVASCCADAWSIYLLLFLCLCKSAFKIYVHL